MSITTGLPSIWRLAWMLFMQPILLHQKMVALGVEPDAPGWRLWQSGGIHRQYFVRLMALGLTILLLGQIIFITNQVAFSSSFSWTVAVVGVVVGVFSGMTIGVVSGVFSGLTFGVILGAIGVTSGVTLGVVFGVTLGIAVGTALGASRGQALDTFFGLGASSAFVSLLSGFGTLATFAPTGVAGGLAFIFSCFRVPCYFIEFFFNMVAFFVQKKHADKTSVLHYQPIFIHDLCYFPLPFLEQHIMLNSIDYPKDVEQALAACARSPGQQGIYRRITARLSAKTIEASARSGNFSPVMTLHGQWLPSAESASQGILAFRDIAKYIEASRYASTTHLRKKYLNDAQLELTRLPVLLAEESKERRAAFAPLQPIWQEKLDELCAKADAEAANSVPNPFLTQPLNTASGVEVFVGRDDLIRTLDAILADPQQRNSLALLGPRRCGKSSLLRMLPLKLPDAVPVFFDLQDNPAGTPAQFFSAIASRAAEQARRERDLVLPKLAPNPDITTFAQWLEQVDTALGSRRLLLCIDEFERLPDLFPGDHRSLLQLMGLFRATVQNRRNIRLLVAGVAPFDELDAIWSDHLINLRELRVEHLDPDSAMRLLTRPIPGFTAIPEAVAREVITRTGCQPLLLQLYGSMLVDRLNAEQRTEATPEDLAAVDRDVREEGNAVNHFRNIYDSAPDDARAVLLALSDPDAPTPKLSSATRRYLLRRCFITPEGVPRIPVFFDWVQAEHG